MRAASATFETTDGTTNTGSVKLEAKDLPAEDIRVLENSLHAVEAARNYEALYNLFITRITAVESLPTALEMHHRAQRRHDFRGEGRETTMHQEIQIELKFVGGPFDGFYDSISSDVQLPTCVALPVNATSGRIFGINVGNAASSRVAIYRLHREEGLSSYEFERMSESEEIARRGQRLTQDNARN